MHICSIHNKLLKYLGRSGHRWYFLSSSQPLIIYITLLLNALRVAHQERLGLLEEKLVTPYRLVSSSGYIFYMDNLNFLEVQT